jgi:threonine synthase
MASKMKQLKTEGTFSVDDAVMAEFRKDFEARRVVGEESLHTIGAFEKQHDYVLDPHTAVGVQAAREVLGEDAEVMCLATAHPGKFQVAVEKGLGREYTLPEELEQLKGLPSRKQKLAPTAEAVKALLLA